MAMAPNGLAQRGPTSMDGACGAECWDGAFAGTALRVVATDGGVGAVVVGATVVVVVVVVVVM